MSYVYEILGRKLTLFLSFITTAVVFYFLPYTAPNYKYLVMARCCIGVTMSAPLCHPLVPDYIHKRSRGKAIALLGVGNVLGDVITLGVIFNLTKEMNFYEAFEVVSVIIAALGVYFLLAIKDPDIEYLRKKAA